jgi:hypothetical protein
VLNHILDNMKQCTKCKQTLSLDQFNKRMGKCKECNKKYYKQYRLNNPEREIKYNKQYFKSKQLPHTIVYLLPDHNYVGVTNNPEYRMIMHRSEHNRNTDNWTELKRFDNRKDALTYESELHAQGYDGAK